MCAYGRAPNDRRHSMHAQGLAADAPLHHRLDERAVYHIGGLGDSGKSRGTANACDMPPSPFRMLFRDRSPCAASGPGMAASMKHTFPPQMGAAPGGGGDDCMCNAFHYQTGKQHGRTASLVHTIINRAACIYMQAAHAAPAAHTLHMPHLAVVCKHACIGSRGKQRLRSPPPRPCRLRTRGNPWTATLRSAS
eukprot:324463-Chlamydomonas_euryale.AAC.7